MKLILHKLILDDKINRILLRIILIISLVILLVLLYLAIDVVVLNHHVIKTIRLLFDDATIKYMDYKLSHLY